MHPYEIKPKCIATPFKWDFLNHGLWWLHNRSEMQENRDFSQFPSGPSLYSTHSPDILIASPTFARKIWFLKHYCRDCEFLSIMEPVTIGQCALIKGEIWGIFAY
jgi:hypothetical protein